MLVNTLILLIFLHLRQEKSSHKTFSLTEVIGKRIWRHEVEMSKYVKKSGLKNFAPPGTLVFTGESSVHKPHISIFSYNEHQIQEKENCAIDAQQILDKDFIHWINVTGLQDVSIIEAIGSRFQIHSLILEDILHLSQRPKMEEFPDYLYFVLSMLQYDDKKQEISSEQVSILLLDNTIITFQEKEGDVFDKIRDRLRKGLGRIRKTKADYLCYALLDAIVDYYFVLLEKIGNTIEDIEDLLVQHTDQSMLNRIHASKRDVIFLRKSIWPVRDLVNGFINTESALVEESSQIFLRDLSDHTSQVIEVIQTYREIVADLLDIYLNSISNRMNEIMKVLTIFAAIFIPLTFLAGVYGMNFEFMPELKWKMAYPVWWIVSIAVMVGMLYFFKKKKWL
jgi:magnesium transporter